MSVLFLNGYILEQQDAYRHKSLIMPERQDPACVIIHQDVCDTTRHIGSQCSLNKPNTVCLIIEYLIGFLLFYMFSILIDPNYFNFFEKIFWIGYEP